MYDFCEEVLDFSLKAIDSLFLERPRNLKRNKNFKKKPRSEKKKIIYGDDSVTNSEKIKVS